MPRLHGLHSSQTQYRETSSIRPTTFADYCHKSADLTHEHFVATEEGGPGLQRVLGSTACSLTGLGEGSGNRSRDRISYARWCLPKRTRLLWAFLYNPVGAWSRRATPLSMAASRTASATCRCTSGSRASGTSSEPEAREARTSAAASFISASIRSAPESRAPRKIPG